MFHSCTKQIIIERRSDRSVEIEERRQGTRSMRQPDSTTDWSIPGTYLKVKLFKITFVAKALSFHWNRSESDAFCKFGSCDKEEAVLVLESAVFAIEEELAAGGRFDKMESIAKGRRIHPRRRPSLPPFGFRSCELSGLCIGSWSSSDPHSGLLRMSISPLAFLPLVLLLLLALALVWIALS